MTRKPDQLDMQIHFAVRVIRQQAAETSRRIREWEPAPMKEMARR